MRTAVRRQVAQAFTVSKGAFYEGLAGTRCGSCNSFTASSHSIMARNGHVATTNMYKVKVSVSNYKVAPTDGFETGNGSATITASIEYPASNFNQLTFGGKVQGSLADASTTGGSGTCLESDYIQLTVPIPAGAIYWDNQFWNNAAGINYSDGSLVGGLSPDSTLGDRFNFSSPTPIDMTMGGTIPQENAGKFTFPLGGIMTLTNAPSVIGAGDSILFGLKEVTGIKDGRSGSVFRGFPTGIAFLNHGAPSAKAATYYTWVTNRKQMWKYMSHLLEQLGYNDCMFDNHSAAQIEADLRNLVWPMAPLRAKRIRTTLTPASTSGNGWIDAGGQTTFSQNSVKNTFNADVRAGLNGYIAYFESAWQLETAHDNGIWVFDGVFQEYTPDGFHPNLAIGNTLVAAAVDMTKITWPYYN